MSLTSDSFDLQSDLVALRHRLHQEPEIGLHLPRTQEKVLGALESLPYEIKLGESSTSVTALLRGTKDQPAGKRPVALLRADMDALPIQELTGVDYSSRVDGVMHACGHDLHTAMLVGAARLLADRRDQLAGDVVLMFQPGEEGFDGAAHMIREGVLDAAGSRADAAYALHVFSSFEPHGQFFTKAGVLMSAADGLYVTVRGKGGHGSTPHGAKDPVTAAAEMITALQVMITRQFNMFDPVVLSVGLVQAGTQRNVIPETAHFEATVRTYSHESRDKMVKSLPNLLQGIAKAHGVEVEVDYRAEYPLSITSEAETLAAEVAVEKLFNEGRFRRWETPFGGSEDFSRVMAEVPGAYIGLSAVAPGEDHTRAPFNHSAYATFDDGVLCDGAALYAELALSKIESLVLQRTITTEEASLTR